MPIKYHCPKCGKRYVEWGAQKLGFRCPACKDSDLVRLGAGSEKPAPSPVLRRRVRVPAEEEEAAIVPLEEPSEDAEEFPVAITSFTSIDDDSGDVAPGVDLTGGVLDTPDEIDFDHGAGFDNGAAGDVSRSALE